MRMVCRFILAFLAAALVLAGCNQTAAVVTDETTDTTSPTTGSTATATSGEDLPGFPGDGASIPIDELTKIRWQIVQSDKVTQLTTDEASTARLYLDLYLGQGSATPALVDQFVVDEWLGVDGESMFFEVPMTRILSNLLGNDPNAALTVGATYHWRVDVKDSLNNSWSSKTYSFTVAPPHATSPLVGRDYGGYFVYWGVPVAAVGFNKVPVCNLVVATAASYTPTLAANVTGVHKIGSIPSAVASTAFDYLYKAYVPATVDLTVPIVAKVIVQDADCALSTVCESVQFPGTSWFSVRMGATTTLNRIDNGIILDGVNLANTNPRNIWTLNPTVEFEPVSVAGSNLATVPFVADPDYRYQLWLSDPNGSTPVYKGSIVSGAAVGGLSYASTYAIQIRAYNVNDGSTPSTGDAPVLAFQTQPYSSATVFDFGANDISTGAGSSPGPTDLMRTGTITTSIGNGYPSLILKGNGTVAEIVKTAADDINPYQKATLKFDFRVPSNTADAFSIVFDNHNAESTFNPFGYSIATPSGAGNTLWTTLTGLVFAAKYYGDDPHVSSTNTLPVFKLYGYTLAADNTVTDPNNSNAVDGDALPDVLEVDLGTIQPGTWYTLTIVTNMSTKATAAMATLSPAAGTPGSPVAIDITQMAQFMTVLGTANPNVSSIYNLNLDGMVLSSLVATTSSVYIDNLSYTLQDATYTRSIGMTR